MSFVQFFMYCKAKKKFRRDPKIFENFWFSKIILSKLGRIVEDFNSSWLWLLRGSPVVVIGLGKNLLCKSVLGHCDIELIQIRLYFSLPIFWGLNIMANVSNQTVNFEQQSIQFHNRRRREPKRMDQSNSSIGM